MSVRGLLAVGTSSSSNIDTRVCCYFGLLKLSICVCGMFVSDHHSLSEKVPLSVTVCRNSEMPYTVNNIKPEYHSCSGCHHNCPYFTREHYLYHCK